MNRKKLSKCWMMQEIFIKNYYQLLSCTALVYYFEISYVRAVEKFNTSMVF